MKFVKPFGVFESLDGVVDRFQLEERLIDFQHLGLSNLVVAYTTNSVLDFEKKSEIRSRPTDVHDLCNSYVIKSHEVSGYNTGISSNCLTIGLSPVSGSLLLNLSEVGLLYEDLCYYLSSLYGLKPNYIFLSGLDVRTNTGGGFGGYLYFKDFGSVKEFLCLKSAVDKENIRIGLVHLGFYK